MVGFLFGVCFLELGWIWCFELVFVAVWVGISWFVCFGLIVCTILMFFLFWLETLLFGVGIRREICVSLGFRADFLVWGFSWSLIEFGVWYCLVIAWLGFGGFGISELVVWCLVVGTLVGVGCFVGIKQKFA